MPTENMQSQSRITRLTGFLKNDPDNLSLLCELADLQIASGGYQDARDMLQRALKLEPNNLAIRFRMADIDIAMGDLVAAEAALQKLESDGCTSPAIAHNLAFVDISRGNYQAALRILLAQPLHATLPENIVLQLHCLHQLGDIDGALHEVENALQHWSNDARLLGWACLLQLDANHISEARKYAALYAQQPVETIEGLICCGTLALADRDPSAAENLFQRAIERSPSQGRAWSGLATAYLLNEKLAASQDAFNRAVTLMPDHVGTWLTKGWCEIVSGDLTQAETDFQAALMLDRNFAESHGSLAVVLVLQHKKDAAQTSLELALRLNRKCLSAQFAASLLSRQIHDAESCRQFVKKLLQENGGLVIKSE